ncbi:MAG: gliding motility protein GldB [Candidatus Azobacteroides sp.]|nr:gliding motility protein GldB [Candidatus Azobacteroides sp.]
MKILSLFVLGMFLFACSGKKAYGESHPEAPIIRFDQDLYRYLVQNENDEALEAYKLFLDEYGEKVIYIGKTDSADFYLRLKTFFSEPTLMKLYQDEQTRMADIHSINEELAEGMKILLAEFPSLKQPKIYMHVSGLNQNVIVSDDILSLSADKYLGADYPLYQDFFYEYQRQLMSPDRIVPDYLLGFMMANFPFKGNEDVLLDRMLYEGKLRYILSCLLPRREAWEYIGYTPEQYRWCMDRQSKIWRLALENQHLFQPDYFITSQYLKEAPSTPSLPSDSPGRVGIWLGYQIIHSYMKNNASVSLQALMKTTNYRELLKQSKYKP